MSFVDILVRYAVSCVFIGKEPAKRVVSAPVLDVKQIETGSGYVA